MYFTTPKQAFFLHRGNESNRYTDIIYALRTINESFYVSRGLGKDCVSRKVANCSMMAGRKSSVSAPDLIMPPFEWRSLHSNQVTGTPNSRSDSYLKPPSSLSEKPPSPFVFSQAPINLRTVCLLMLLITTRANANAHACMHGFQAGSGDQSPGSLETDTYKHWPSGSPEI